MPIAERFALVDESGGLTDPHTGVVVIAVIVADSQERGLTRLLAKTRRHLPHKGERKRERQIGELKFYTTSVKTRRQVLRAIAKQPVTLFILVLAKEDERIKDTPENYARLVGGSLLECARQFPGLERIFVDRHFSKRADQERFNRQVCAKLGRTIEIKHVDSMQDSRIDLADFVAGAVAYAHQHGDRSYEDLIRHRFATYRVVRWIEKEEW